MATIKPCKNIGEALGKEKFTYQRSQSQNRILIFFTFIKKTEATVWSVNDGLSGNLRKPPETSEKPPETSGNLRKPATEVSGRFPNFLLA
jgi:hypothetical protein